MPEFRDIVNRLIDFSDWIMNRIIVPFWRIILPYALILLMVFIGWKAWGPLTADVVAGRIHLKSSQWVCTNTQTIVYPVYNGRDVDQQEIKKEIICLQWSKIHE